MGRLAAVGAGALQDSSLSLPDHVTNALFATDSYERPLRLQKARKSNLLFLFICLAVMIPGWLSDIVYPLLSTRKARKEYSRHGHQHPH